MDSHDHCNSPGGGKSHVCTKCGWNYPNPHPSAKNRRAHKKVCGTIKGFELIDSVNAKQNLDLQEEHCLEDDPKTPSPRVVAKADERIGDVSEEDVFTDAVCEFSSSLVSDSFKEKENTATKCVVKNLGETQQCDDSTTDSVMKSSEVVQESCEVIPMEVREKCNNVPSSVAIAFDNQQGAESSIASEALIKSLQEAQVTDSGDTISNAVLETERKGNLPDESESKLASALGKKEDTSNSSWNDEVIYSDVEGPQEFVLEASSMTHPGEADSIVSQNVPVDTSPMKANAAQLISTSQPVPDDVPSVENADVSLHGNNGHEEYEVNRSVNLFRPETPEEGKYETDTLSQAKNIGIQPEGFDIDTAAPSSDKLLFEDKIARQVQTENLTESTIDPEDKKMKAEMGESSFGSAQETVESERLRVSQPAVDPIAVDWNEDVSHAASKTGIVDLTSHESELIQANDVAEEGNNPKNQPSSESSFGAENYVSPVSVEFEGDYASVQRKSSTETPNDEACESNDEAHRETSKRGLDASDQVSVVFEGDDAKDQLKHSTETSENIQIGAEECERNDDEAHIESSKGRLDASNQVAVVLKGDDANDQREHSKETSENIQIGAEECESNAEARRESCIGRLEEESSFIKETITKEYPLSHPDSIDTASDESFKSANQKSLESGRTEFHKIVGGLGVIQGNEIDGNSSFYAEVPVTIESNDHRDFGRLQNLSEAHIRSLVSSPLVNRNNTSQAFESNLGLVSGLSRGYNKPEHGFQNQEITLEKTTSWSSTKEQHVPLKNLLNEARSPKLQLEAKDHHENNNIQRVSSILGQETSPEDGRWPETREVSQEWHSPAKYPVGLKREERKVKGRPFWVPFVCCSSVK